MNKILNITNIWSYEYCIQMYQLNEQIILKIEQIKFQNNKIANIFVTIELKKYWQMVQTINNDQKNTLQKINVLLETNKEENRTYY